VRSAGRARSFAMLLGDRAAPRTGSRRSWRDKLDSRAKRRSRKKETRFAQLARRALARRRPAPVAPRGNTGEKPRTLRGMRGGITAGQEENLHPGAEPSAFFRSCRPFRFCSARTLSMAAGALKAGDRHHPRRTPGGAARGHRPKMRGRTCPMRKAPPCRAMGGAEPFAAAWSAFFLWEHGRAATTPIVHVVQRPRRCSTTLPMMDCPGYAPTGAVLHPVPAHPYSPRIRGVNQTRASSPICR